MKVRLVKIARSDRWYATWAVDGRSFRQSMRTSDRRTAEARAASLRFAMTRDSSVEVDHFQRLVSPGYARSLLARLVRVARRGNDRRQVQISETQLLRLMKKSGGKCAVSGLPLSFTNDSGCPRNPWAPSIDRIDSTKPYTIRNVRVVCVAANTAMSDWGAGVLVKLSEGVAMKHGIRANYAQIPEVPATAESG